MLNKLIKTTRKKSRVGRGISAGQGKTAGRGTKGQKSRSGYNIPNRFEGGQTPLFARIPKIKGGLQTHSKKVIALNIDDLDRLFDSGAKIDRKAIIAKGIVKKDEKSFDIKILARGKTSKKFDLSECKLSKGASKILLKPTVNKKTTPKTNAAN